MNWLVSAYNILVGALVIDAAANTLAALYMFMMRRSVGRWWAVMFASVALEAWVYVAILGQRPATSRASGWTITALILARIIKTVGIGALTLYLLGYLNGRGRRQDNG